jgi:hypothetical protein
VSPPAAESPLRVGEGQGERSPGERATCSNGTAPPRCSLESHVPGPPDRHAQATARHSNPLVPRPHLTALVSIMAPNQKHPPGPTMTLKKPLALAAVLLVGLTLTQSASRYGRAPSSRANHQRYPTRVPIGIGSYGGYSTDPHTRELQMLADKYRPTGW